MHLRIYSSIGHLRTPLSALVQCSCSHPDRPTHLQQGTVIWINSYWVKWQLV